MDMGLSPEASPVTVSTNLWVIIPLIKYRSLTSCNEQAHLFAGVMQAYFPGAQSGLGAEVLGTGQQNVVCVVHSLTKSVN